jgi:hypothetical protein
MHIGAILLITLIVLVCLGAGAILRTLAGLITLGRHPDRGRLVDKHTPWAQEQARRSALERQALDQIQQHGGQI